MVLAAGQFAVLAAGQQLGQCPGRVPQGGLLSTSVGRVTAAISGVGAASALVIVAS